MQVHPKVRDLAHEKQLSHEEAEALLRGQATRDPAAKTAIDLIDATRAEERKSALALNTGMAKRLGLEPDEAAALVAKLAADAPLWTWLARRVQLTLADGQAPAHDAHHSNE